MSLVFFVMEKGDLERTKKRVWDFLETQVYDPVGHGITGFLHGCFY